MSEDNHKHDGLNPNFSLADVLQQPDESTDATDEVQVAVAAANRLFDEMHTDQKTGLRSGDFFKKQLDKTIEEIEANRKHGINDTAAVTLYDVNGFKPVNDSLGHAKGDELLGILGDAFRAVYRRSGDHVARGSRDDASAARLHGDELAAQIRRMDDTQEGTKRLPHTILEEAEKQALRVEEEFRERIKGTLFDSPTLKVGLAHASKEYQTGDTAETLLFRADVDMLVNKSLGKIESLDDEDKLWLEEPTTIRMIQKLNIRLPEWLTAYLADHQSVDTRAAPPQQPSDHQPNP